MAVFKPNNWASVVVVFGILGCSAILWIHAVRAEKDIMPVRQELHRNHIRRFGEIRYGLGLQVDHLDVNHPARKRVVEVYRQLQVGVTVTWNWSLLVDL